MAFCDEILHHPVGIGMVEAANDQVARAVAPVNHRTQAYLIVTPEKPTRLFIRSNMVYSMST
jgi:hypothetical protein